MALSALLNNSFRTSNSPILGEDQAALFSTAAVEMWHRAIHSLITALSLGASSEIWSCVAGYYASHYSVRAFAHLFGYFSLYSRKLLIEVTPSGARFQCSPVGGVAKSVRSEHQFYWTIVKKLPDFATDRLFTNNTDQASQSDAAHRGVASYVDHLDRFTPYNSIDRDEVRRRFVQLATTALQGQASISIPDRQHYPQLGVVLSVAYLRIYRFREYLDEMLPVKRGFWARHRIPPWYTGLLPFPSRPEEMVPVPL